jgi:hypothetical protein
MTQTKREVVELVDGRVYYSDDNWEHVWRREQIETANSCHVTDYLITGEEADFARFLAVTQAGPGA